MASIINRLLQLLKINEKFDCISLEHIYLLGHKFRKSLHNGFHEYVGEGASYVGWHGVLIRSDITLSETTPPKQRKFKVHWRPRKFAFGVGYANQNRASYAISVSSSMFTFFLFNQVQILYRKLIKSQKNAIR